MIHVLQQFYRTRFETSGSSRFIRNNFHKQMMLHDPEIGHRLLLQSTPVENRQQAEQLIKQRTASHPLFAIKSARVNHDWPTHKHSKVPKSMPGIGDPFWKNRSDHMHSYVMPPAIHKQLLGEKEIPTTQLMQTYRNYNRENWQPSETNMYYMKHEQTQLVKTPNNMPAMRIPVFRTDHKQIFQNGQPIILEQTYVAFHGTRELLIEPILKNSQEWTQGKHSLAFNNRNMVQLGIRRSTGMDVQHF